MKKAKKRKNLFKIKTKKIKLPIMVFVALFVATCFFALYASIATPILSEDGQPKPATASLNLQSQTVQA